MVTRMPRCRSDRDASALRQVTADLPAGFSALWMETTDIRLSCGMEPFDAQPDAADQLCRLLSCAPDSYRRVELVRVRLGLGSGSQSGLRSGSDQGQVRVTDGVRHNAHASEQHYQTPAMSRWCRSVAAVLPAVYRPRRSALRRVVSPTQRVSIASPALCWDPVGIAHHSVFFIPSHVFTLNAVDCCQPACGCACRELRLGPSLTASGQAAAQYQLGVELTWQIGTRGTPERVRQDSVVAMGGGVDGIARELDRVAAGHGLTVCVPDSRQYIKLSRA